VGLSECNHALARAEPFSIPTFTPEKIMKIISQMKRPGTTMAGIFSLALVSVVLLCGAGSVPVENFTPQGPMQADLNAGGHNLTNVATVSAANVVVSGTLTAPNLGSAATNAASAFAPAAGPFAWADVTGAPAWQTPITLTTTGTSGAATLSSGTLNIPQYQGGVTSFNTRSGAITLTASDINATGTIDVTNTGTSSYATTSGTSTYATHAGSTSTFTGTITSSQVSGLGALATITPGAGVAATATYSANTPGGVISIGGGMAANGDAPYVPSFLAKLNKVRAGAATNVKVVLIGDSTTAGYGATSNTNWAGDKALSPSVLIANRLMAAGVPAYDAGWYGLGTGSASTLTLYDPRVTYGGGWSQYYSANCLGGGFMQSSSSTDTLTFSPGFPYNTIEVYYAVSSGNGSFTLSSGTTVTGTVSTSGSPGIGKQTYAVSLTSNPINIQATSTTACFIAGVLCYNTNTPGILFINASQGGATTGNIITGSGFNAEGSITALSPDLSIINMMINDCNNGSTTSSTYQSNLSTIVTYCQNYGSVMLATPVPAGATTYLTNAASFLTATKAVATTDTCSLVDVSTLMPSYSVQNTLGLRFDSLHPNAAGYQFYSSLLANALLQICGPTSSTAVTQTVVNGSTGGSAVFSEPSQLPSSKKVVIELGSTLSGTATYTLPTPFTYTPLVVNSDAAVPAPGTGTIVVTGTGTLPRTVVLEGY